MTAVFAAHLVVAVACALLAGRLRTRVFLVGALAPLVAVVALVVVTPAVLDGTVESATVSWVPGLGLDFTVRLDAFALLMACWSPASACWCMAYAWQYFSGRPPRPTWAGSPARSCCSPPPCSASSSPTTCSCCTCSGS